MNTVHTPQCSAGVDAYLCRESRRLKKSLNKVVLQYLEAGTKTNRKIDETVTAPDGTEYSHWFDKFAKKGTVDDKTLRVLAK